MGISREEKQRRDELFEQGLKVCCTCKRELLFNEFNKNKSCIDGLSRMCRSCTKQNGRKYYQDNREHMKERTRKWRKENPEKMKEYRLNNLDYFIDYNQKYRQDHKDYFKQYHKEHDKEYLNSERGRLVFKRTQHRRRAIEKSAKGSHTVDELQSMLVFFENKCAYTGETLEQDYHLDHVVPLSKNGTNYIWNIVPSNKSPNCSKGDRDMEEWFRKQPYFSEERLQKIYDWMQLKQKDIKGEENDERHIEEIA